MTWWEGVATGAVGTLVIQSAALFYTVRRIARNPQGAARLLMKRAVKPAKTSGKPVRSYN